MEVLWESLMLKINLLFVEAKPPMYNKWMSPQKAIFKPVEGVGIGRGLSLPPLLGKRQMDWQPPGPSGLEQASQKHLAVFDQQVYRVSAIFWGIPLGC